MAPGSMASAILAIRSYIKKKATKTTNPNKHKGKEGGGGRGWRVFVEKGEAAQTPAEGEEMQEVQRGTFPNLAAIQ